MTHTDLIEKLSKLDGPCRECDALIAAMTLTCADLPYDEADPMENGKVNLYLRGKRVAKVSASEYTASIDAALTLVPEGCDWFINGRYNHAHVWQKKETGLDGSWTSETNIQGHGNPANPAIAITIAALRAIEAMEGE